MIKKLFRLACVAIMLACSASVSAQTSDSVEILTDFADYNHQNISPVQEIVLGNMTITSPMKFEANPTLGLGIDKYVDNIEIIEQASCMDASKMKDFMKKCKKVIKKMKAPLISKNKSEDTNTKIYAKKGCVIALTQIDNDLAVIVALVGTPAGQ